MPKVVVRILLFWYREQLFYVKWNDTLSSPFRVTNGVRQGGVLSPILFNVFTDELSTKLVASNIGCYMNDMCYNHICYADDSIIMAPSAGALQELINICQEYANEYEMLYNTKKTVCLSFLPNQSKHLDIPLVYLNNKPLKWVPDHKYLGVILNSKKDDNLDIQRQIRASYTQGNSLICAFRHCSENVKCHLFKTYCYNLYGSQLWCANNVSIMRRMKVAYNDVFRKLMGFKRGQSISQAYMCANILGFDALLRKRIWSCYKRLQNSTNPLINHIVLSPYFIHGSKMYSTWRDKLYIF